MWYSYTINALKYIHSYLHVPVPVAAPSKAWVCGYWLLGIAGLNPAGAWMSLVSVVCYQVQIY